MRKRSSIQTVKPEIKVEPVINIEVPKTDMKPIIDALMTIQPSVKLSDEFRTLEIEVTERDRSGAIKKLVCTEVLV